MTQIPSSDETPKAILLIFPQDEERARLVHWLADAAGVGVSIRTDIAAVLTDPAIESGLMDKINLIGGIIMNAGEDRRAMEEFEKVRDMFRRMGPIFREIPIFILGPSTREPFDSHKNRNLPQSSRTPKMVEDILSRMNLDLQLRRTPPFSMETGYADLQGNLQDLTLGETMTWISEMDMNGHWYIQARGHFGYMLMYKGNITYAEFDEHRAERAVLEMLDATALDQRSEYRFSRFEPNSLLGKPPRNITETTERMLMAVMVDLDHRNAERSGISH